MTIVSVSGAMPGYDFGLSRVLALHKSILEELGVEVREINLPYLQIPHFDGMQANGAAEVMSEIRGASGVILATSVNMALPAAPMTTFLEYFALPENAGVLSRKNCFMITVAQYNGERAVLNQLSDIVNQLGGFDSQKLGLNANLLAQWESNGALRQIVEKQVEDFYRIVGQNRQFIIPGYGNGQAPAAGLDAGTPTDHPMPPDPYQYLRKAPAAKPKKTAPAPGGAQPDAEAKRVKNDIAALYQKFDMQKFTASQEQDIEDLTRYFTGKYESANQTGAAPFGAALAPAAAVEPRAKSCRQLTQNLIHYFQPQLCQGLTAVIQLVVSGGEAFEGYLCLESNECVYHDGQADHPDITILADAGVWADVLNGRHSAQKAFMVGQLKVRGNFVLLTKFDQLFKRVG